jgi:hypothetical protein
VTGFGDLYVATNTLAPVTGNLQPGILKVSASGVQTPFATLSVVNFSAEGLAIDRAGNVFVVAFDLTSPATASTIFKFTPDGAESTFGSLPGQGFGLAFDAAGNLFAADASDQTIFKFTPAGAQSVFVGPAAFTGVQFPVGLAFDRSGNLLVTTEGNEGSPGGDAILVFAPDATESTFATDLADPRGIAFDPSGDLLVAELKLLPAPGDILKFSTNGSQTIFASGIGQPQVMAVRSSWRSAVARCHNKLLHAGGAYEATLALWMMFLVGRQAMFWQEPPTYFRSMATVFIPSLARVQEMSLPPVPLPNTRRSYSSRFKG